MGYDTQKVTKHGPPDEPTIVLLKSLTFHLLDAEFRQFFPLRRVETKSFGTWAIAHQKEANMSDMSDMSIFVPLTTERLPLTKLTMAGIHKLWPISSNVSTWQFTWRLLKDSGKGCQNFEGQAKQSSNIFGHFQIMSHVRIGSQTMNEASQNNLQQPFPGNISEYSTPSSVLAFYKPKRLELDIARQTFQSSDRLTVNSIEYLSVSKHHTTLGRGTVQVKSAGKVSVRCAPRCPKMPQVKSPSQLKLRIWTERIAGSRAVFEFSAFHQIHPYGLHETCAANVKLAVTGETCSRTWISWIRWIYIYIYLYIYIYV